MKLWAFATSPYGLGLTSEAFWSMTPREIVALQEVWVNRELREQAFDRAMFANAHRAASHAPFGIDDFLPSAHRVQVEETPEQRMQRFKSTIQTALGKAELPDWAKPKGVN